LRVVFAKFVSSGSLAPWAKRQPGMIGNPCRRRFFKARGRPVLHHIHLETLRRRCGHISDLRRRGDDDLRRSAELLDLTRHADALVLEAILRRGCELPAALFEDHDREYLLRVRLVEVEERWLVVASARPAGALDETADGGPLANVRLRLRGRQRSRLEKQRVSKEWNQHPRIVRSRCPHAAAENVSRV